MKQLIVKAMVGLLALLWVPGVVTAKPKTSARVAQKSQKKKVKVQKPVREKKKVKVAKRPKKVAPKKHVEDDE